MKNILIAALILLAGISFGATTVSDLVRTNEVITADGSDWKTLTNDVATALAGGAMENVDVAIYYYDGSVELVTNLASRTVGLNKSTGGPILSLTNCVAYQLRPVEMDNYRFWLGGSNFVYNGQGNLITVTMDEATYSGNEGFAIRNSTDFQIENVDLLWNLTSTYSGYTNPASINTYLVYPQDCANYVFKDSRLQYNYMVDGQYDADRDYIKAFTDVDLAGEAVVDGCTFIMLAPNSTNAIFSHAATHSASGTLYINNTDFITSDNLVYDFYDGGLDNVELANVRANMVVADDPRGYDSSIGYISDEEAKSLLVQGTQSLWVDGQSDRPEPLNWQSVTGYETGINNSIFALSTSQVTYRLDDTQDSTVFAGFTADAGRTGTVRLRGRLIFPDVATSNAIYNVRVGVSIANDEATSWATAATFKYATIIYTNSTGADVVYEYDETITGVTNGIVAVGAARRYSSEANTAGQYVAILGGQSILVY